MSQHKEPEVSMGSQGLGGRGLITGMGSGPPWVAVGQGLQGLSLSPGFLGDPKSTKLQVLG